MFNELKTLVKFLDKAKVDHLDIFTIYDFQHPKSKMAKLFELLKKDEIKSFDSLKNEIYFDSNKDWGYKKIILRFKEKLINTIFFADTSQPMFSERSRAYYICARRTLLVRMLIERGTRKLSIELAENTIGNTIKYEFTELTVLLSKFLMRQYSGALPNFKKYNYYRRIFSSAVELNAKELSMEEMMCSVLYKRNSSKKITSKQRDMEGTNELILEEAENLVTTNPSVELIISGSTIILDNYRDQKNFVKYKEWTLKFTEMIFSKPFLSTGTLEILITSQLRITLISKDKLTAFELKELYFDKLNIGNFNWFLANWYFILTLLHCKEYQASYTHLNKISENKLLEKQPEVIKENFYIVLAFISYLIKTNVIITNREKEEFRLSKFLNQMPEFSFDKQGTNIPILLIQILFFLADKKYSKIIDRIESLNLYSYRHLKKDENFRSQCFIRMISEMVRADFRKQGTIFRTEKLLTKLKAVPIDMYPATAETEIIPYEDLWEMVVERLD